MEQHLTLQFKEFNTPEEVCAFFTANTDTILVSLVYTQGGFTVFFYTVETPE